MIKIAGVTIGVMGIGLFVVLFNGQIASPDIVEDADLTTKIDAIDNWLSQLRDDDQFNGAVLITRDGTPLLMKSYGYTDYLESSALTTESSFRLASLSKAFTAAGILILQEKGLLHIDDLVVQHISNYPYDDVTIRHLLTHTSGISDGYMALAQRNQKSIGDILSISEVIDLISQDPPRRLASPNEEYQYSNTGYVSLAGVIESVSGRTFETFLQSELFDPMDMDHCRVWNLLSEDKTFEGKTSSYAQVGANKFELKPTYIDGVAGDGAVFCSISDFLIWDAFWYSNGLISDDLLTEALTIHQLSDGTPTGYGLGWRLEDDIVLHSGVWLGARTYIRRNIRKKTCLVILDNSKNKKINQIIKKLRESTDNF